jgi:phosphatidylserine/phosphatidylglycerophosphate/cardiolipin synthase-like enzyme
MPIFRPGNRITLLQSGAEQYFPALEAAIDAAQRDVYIETYIFADDPTGRRIGDALVRAAQRDVAVKVVVDGFGTRPYSGSLLTELQSRGVEVTVYRAEAVRFHYRRNRLRRLHRKITVVDGRIAFVGGINIIDDMNTPRHVPPRFDYAVRIEGPLLLDIYPVVRRLWLMLRWVQLSYQADDLDEPVLSSTPVGDCSAAFIYRDNLRHRRDIESNTSSIENSRSKSSSPTPIFPRHQLPPCAGCGGKPWCARRAATAGPGRIRAAPLCFACAVRNTAQRRRGDYRIPQEFHARQSGRVRRRALHRGLE